MVCQIYKNRREKIEVHLEEKSDYRVEFTTRSYDGDGKRLSEKVMVSRCVCRVRLVAS